MGQQKLNSTQRKYLRGLAHHLNPVVMYGQHGLTPAFLQAMEKALSDHELIKMKFIDGKEEKKALATEIAQKTAAALVGLVGNVGIYYRANLKKKNKILLP